MPLARELIKRCLELKQTVTSRPPLFPCSLAPSAKLEYICEECTPFTAYHMNRLYLLILFFTAVSTSFSNLSLKLFVILQLFPGSVFKNCHHICQLLFLSHWSKMLHAMVNSSFISLLNNFHTFWAIPSRQLLHFVDLFYNILFQHFILREILHCCKEKF